MGDYKSQSTTANPWSITTQRAPEAAQLAGLKGIPEGPISITPALIQQQRAAYLLASNAGPDLTRLFGVAKPYEIGFGDVLSITVWGHPELASLATGGGIDGTGVVAVASGYNVNTDGLIQFPFIGSIKLSGLTEIAARDKLTKDLAKFIKDPEISLRVQAFRSSRVYVEGEVRTPGMQAINDVPLSLPELLGRTGGLTVLADRSSVFVTRDSVTTRINMVDLERQKISPGSILLSNKDSVRVGSREDNKVYVLGEVSKPSALIMRDARMSLSEALGESGGISQISGNPRQVYVLRNGASGIPDIFHLDAGTAVSYALAGNFELMPRDVVFVDPSDLVRFNRVISLLVPSTQGANSAIDLSRK
jgi:polysaccharide export outer membrane protein